MPIIHFTAADVLQTKVVENGIYPSEVSKLEVRAASSGKTNNYFVDVTIVDGKYKGKTLTLIFNTGVKAASIMGKQQMFPSSGLIEVYGAITGKEVKPENFSVDTDELLHKPFDTAWGTATDEGILFNIINGFYPKGYAASAPAF